MKSNDLSAKMRARFKASNDFDKLFKQLEKEGYDIQLKGYTKVLTNEEQKQEYGFNISMLIFEAIVMKDNKRIVNVLFENNRQEDSYYKQNIIAIYY